MRCHVCNVAVGDGQRFCHECGESLDGVTNPTEPLEVIGEGTVDPSDAPTVERVDELLAAATAAAAADAATDADAGADVKSEADADADANAESDEASSETVDPPEIDEPEVDEPGWWADDPPPPAVDGPFAPVGTPSAPDDGNPAYASTEALGVVVASTPSPMRSALDAIPDEQYSASPAYEATTAMAAVGAAAPTGVGVTDEFPVQQAGVPPVFDGIDDVDEYTVPPSEGFRLRASFVFGFLAMVATLMASVADLIDIRTSRPVDGIRVGIRVMEDFGTNLPVAGFIGAAVMLIGGLLSCFGLRSGAGLAGGAGLALTGWAAMTIGLVEVPIHTAEGITRNTGADVNGFTLSVTRDLGWFLIVAVGVLGLIVFLTTLRMAGTGGRPGLNPWVSALGGVGAVILAAGPLIPLGEATVDLNLGFVGLPRAFFAGRLVQLAMIALTGIVGFLSVRTYGLGLAAGGMSVAAWLWATSLAEVGEQPVSVAVGNLGTVDTTPHAVTSVGLALALVMLAVSTALAIVNRPRR